MSSLKIIRNFFSFFVGGGERGGFEISFINSPTNELSKTFKPLKERKSEELEVSFIKPLTNELLKTLKT